MSSATTTPSATSSSLSSSSSSTAPHTHGNNRTLLALKVKTKSRSITDKQSSDRQRDCLVLILSFLRHFGYVESAAQLQNEGGTALTKLEVADNVDLVQVLTEYEEFYEMKFKRKPKFSRLVAGLGTGSGARSGMGMGTMVQGSGDGMVGSRGRRGRRSGVGVGATPKQLLPSQHVLPPSKMKEEQGMLVPSMNTNIDKTNRSSTNSDMNGINGKMRKENKNDPSSHNDFSLHVQGRQKATNASTTETQNPHLDPQQQQRCKESIPKTEMGEHERIIKPLPTFGNNFELRSLAASIQSEILDESLGVTWDDIVALEDAKRLLKEAVILPIQYPELFSGLLVPWKGVLLYGPPGTGKTMLAKAVATESQSTFFNISASSIVSKFRGDSEKLIKVLFELARYHSPSTIFIDEIDSIMGHRGGGGGGCGHNGSSTVGGTGGEGGEHEGSRRMKTELLIEMDGLGKGSQHVFVLAASNMPWDLDPALLRRLEKRVFVPMPDRETRKRLLTTYLSLHAHQLEEKDFDHCALKTEGFSCADIKLLCKEAAMRPIRSIFKMLESIREEPLSSCSMSNKSEKTILDVDRLMKKNPITTMDLMESLECTKPSTDTNLSKRYEEWSNSHGAM